MARRGLDRYLGNLALRGKLLLASVLVEVVMLGLLLGNSVRLIGQHMEHQSAMRIQAIELAYKTALAPPLAARDYATLRDILDGWRKAEDVGYLAVIDRDGRVLAASGWNDGQTLPAAGSREGDVVHIRFAVDYLGQVYGHAQYGLSTRFIAQAKVALLTQGVLIALAEIITTLLLLSLIGYWLTRHLSQLMQASGRVAEGDYDFRLKVDSDDEVGQLAERFNRMADAVRERMDALTDSEQRFRAIADYTYGWESWFAPDGSLRWVNPAVERVTGYTQAECEAMADFPMRLVFGDDVDMVRQCHALGLAGQTGQDREFRVRRKDGHVVWVAMSWQPIFDVAGRSLGYRSSVRDISLEHMAREELVFQASHDALTGLHNRRAFEGHLAEALALVGQGGEPRALLYIDLDQFKLVNDTCGHSAGDDLLQEIAAIMRRGAGDGFLARLGGDEFGLLLATSLDQARRRAEKLIDGINAHVFSYEGHYFQLGASIGLVEIRADGGHPEHGIDALLIAADQACYAAKDKGRNRVEVYVSDDAYYQSQRAQFLSVARIAGALREGRMSLHYQRIEPLRPDLGHHVEILLRMVAENGRLISPGVFIPAAERFNLMPQVDRWVIDEVCRILGGRHGGGLAADTVYAVNLSGLTLSGDDFIDYVADCLTRHAVDPTQLCFEITETAAIGNFDRALDFIRKARAMGATVALDDFGAGLSSFAYLRRLEVDFLKIDALFVRNLDTDPRDRAVVKSIMEVARVHGMRTIAEFVHKPEIADILRDMGVDYAQGFALHRPEPLPGGHHPPFLEQ
jgi:diguanylate cyclase (GGDEF)-like protein/PAS domain S-box-containing protein